MALRILVNQEQEELDSLLEVAPRLIRSGGRLVIISFMSSEDRKVKEKFRSLAKEGIGTLLTKRPIEPGEEEIRRNPPSRSAKLRAMEMVGVEQ
jgi:16S rRNA (cytosine1402-N4)-methyltransferase